jgi:hypothetical protein
MQTVVIMDTAMIRVVAGILAVIFSGVIVMRREENGITAGKWRAGDF